MVSVVPGEVRAVMVEHGSFYFDNWPEEADSEDPFEIVPPDGTLASFAKTGIGFYSNCGDGDNTARVRILCYDRMPEHTTSEITAAGSFVIGSDELAVATLMMDPAEPIRSPYKGEVQVRLRVLPLSETPEYVERDGETHQVHEDRLVELWPSGS